MIGVLALVLAAYLPSFRGVFLYDDLTRMPEILARNAIETLSRSSRPLVDASLHLNHAISGNAPWSYHLVNLVVHLISGWLLCALLFHVLRRWNGSERDGAWAVRISVAATGFWLLHPLQTESVTYVIQRAEALMGMFFLLALYARVRADMGTSTRWFMISVAACIGAMLCKPVAAILPVLILLFEVLVLPRLDASPKRPNVLYRACLLGTWLVPFAILATGNESSASAGFAAKVATPLQYLLTEPAVILHYLRLSVWPVGLCLDYDWPLADSGTTALLPGILLLALLAGLCVAFRRRHWLAFPGALFFVTLAPTSSFIPLADCAVEHRMYVPLIALVLIVAVGLAQATARRPRLFLIASLGIAVTLGVLTFQRNLVYGSAQTMWRDVLEKRPENLRAHLCLASELMRVGERRQAAEHCLLVIDRLATIAPQQKEELDAQYQEAAGAKLRHLVVYYASAHNLLGVALASSGEAQMAIPHFREALRVLPELADARHNLAAALARLED